jgi:hypothetical protein
MKKVLLSAGALLLVAAGSLSAETVYIPIPTLNSAKPMTLIEVAKTNGGPQTLNVGFIPTGQSGVDVTESPRNVNNYFRPNVYNPTSLISGSGMLKITNPVGIATVVAAVSLDKGSEDTHWRLPIVSASDPFKAGDTAYLENLERSARGATNIEIMNLGQAPATCQITLKRPRGTVIGAPFTTPLPVLSHKVITDVLAGRLGVPSAAGIKAEVSCNRPFYAYGTYIDTDPLNFRLLYPLDQASTPYVASQTVTVNRPGNFFSPVAGNSELQIDLPLVPNVGYRKAEIEFDLYIDKFAPVFNGIFGFFHPGGPRFGKTLYYGVNIRGLRSRTLLDLGTPAIESAPKRNSPFKEKETYHIRIDYDTESAMVTFLARQKGGPVIAYAQSGAFNLDLADRGSPVRIAFGLNGVADNAYFPPIGWKYSNLEVRVLR